MSSRPSVVPDGGVGESVESKIRIDRSDLSDRYRYTCPNGHTSWDRTNNHVWCHACRRQVEAGEDVDPEYHKIYDKQRDRLIPWEAVEIVGDCARLPRAPWE